MFTPVIVDLTSWARVVPKQWFAVGCSTVQSTMFDFVKHNVQLCELQCSVVKNTSISKLQCSIVKSSMSHCKKYINFKSTMINCKRWILSGIVLHKKRDNFLGKHDGAYHGEIWSQARCPNFTVLRLLFANTLCAI